MKFIKENFEKISDIKNKEIIAVGFYGYKEEIKRQIQKFF